MLGLVASIVNALYVVYVLLIYWFKKHVAEGWTTLSLQHAGMFFFVFLIVAVIASNLSAAAQDRASEAIARRNEVTRLFDLTRDVLLTTETAGAIDVLARYVCGESGR